MDGPTNRSIQQNVGLNVSHNARFGGTTTEYARSIPFTGDAGKALDLAITVLTTNGFAVTDKRETSVQLTGPGLSNTRQNPILGASRVHIRADHGSLSIDAELGGVANMRRFLTVFLLAMEIFFVIVFGVVMGFVFGRQFDVGFGVPFAQGWLWLAFAIPIATLPLLPWLFLSPMIARSIRSRTFSALDTLLANMEVAGRGA